jgi:hypothetical protein
LPRREGPEGQEISAFRGSGKMNRMRFAMTRLPMFEWQGGIESKSVQENPSGPPVLTEVRIGCRIETKQGPSETSRRPWRGRTANFALPLLAGRRAV